jgi:outer membrane receptor protein involved in Fe transport
MNLRFLFTFLAITSFLKLFAQPPGVVPSGGFSQNAGITGKIMGVVLDSTARSFVEFATVVLIYDKTGAQKDGTTTDEKGAFKFLNLKAGKYRLSLSFIGYKTKSTSDIELTPQKPDADLGSLFLASESIDLSAVEVTGEAGAIENKIDKLVYNAEKDLTTAGGNAADVLQRVPLLAVDAEGNLSLRGSSNIQILINGKPSGIFSGNPGDALKSIPADQIKSVEVITSPSARYDGEGTAGIVNIITKRKSVDGFTGSINSSVGTRSNNGSLSMNYAKGRFGLNLNGGGWFNWPRPSFSSFYREDRSGVLPKILSQTSTGSSSFYGPRVTLSAFYDLNAYNSINSSVSFRGFGRSGENITDATYTDPNFGVNQIYTRNSSNASIRGGFDWSTDYRKTFKTEGHELIFAFQVSGDVSDQTNEIVQSGNDPGLSLNTKNDNAGINLENTFQIDYVLPINKKITLETGTKLILRDIDSDFAYKNYSNDLKNFVTDITRSDIFFYVQNVMAGYASVNLKLGDKWGLIAGSRYESTFLNGDYDKNEVSFTNTYDNFLPSVTLNRKLNSLSNIKFSYAKRIQRPSLRYINPYVEIEDPRDVTVGNPEVEPENTDQYEINYSTFVKGIVINSGIFYRQTNDVIESFLTISKEGVSINSFRNIGINRNYGVNLFSSANIKDKLSLRGGVNVSLYNVSGNIDGRVLTNEAIVWNGNLSSTVTLPANFKFEVNGFYSSPRASLQGTRASYQRISFAIQKDIWKKKGSIGIVAVQPFSRDLRFINELEGTNFYQRSENAFAQRSYGINFSYRFGKLDFKAPKERAKRVNNRDLKDDGGDNSF